MKKINWNKNARFHYSGFGKFISFDLPEKTDVIIICVNKGFGLIPVELCLSHQVYEAKIKRYLEIHNAKQITLIPAKSEDYIGLFAEFGKPFIE